VPRAHEADLRLLCSIVDTPVDGSVDQRMSAGRMSSRLAALPGDRIEAVTALARRHGVEAWLAAVAPDVPAWQELTEQRARFMAARARAVGELHRFGAIAADLDCPWLVLKGQAVAEDLYPRPYFRHSMDIDVLVPPDRFAQLCAALEQHGWRLLDRNWPLLAATMPGELRYRSPTGGLFDVHWQVMNNPGLRAHFPLPTAELLSRARTLPSGLPALDPVDQLLHLCLHAALSGGNRLMWLLDCARSAGRIADWQLAADRAASSGTTLAVATILQRASGWLSVPAPGTTLGGGSWRLVCRLADGRSGLPADPDRPALARSLARSVQPGVAASFAALARHGTGWLAAGALWARRDASLGDVTDPGSPLYDDADATARERYLSAVPLA
jgi:hypothetical protein